MDYLDPLKIDNVNEILFSIVSLLTKEIIILPGHFQ